MRGPVEETNHARTLQPERDYRGRVVRKEPMSEAATRVSTAERLAVVVTGLLLLVAVLAIVKLGVDADGGNRADPTLGVALEGSDGPPAFHPPDSPPATPTPDEATPAPVPASESTPTPAPAPTPVVAVRPPPKPEPTPAPVPVAPVATGPGTLTVSTYPWAQIFVDGEALGRTPLKGHALAAGPHELKLVVPAAGGKQLTETVMIESDKDTKIVKRIEVPADPAVEAPE